MLIASRLDRDRYEPLVVVPAAGPLVGDLTAAGVEVLVRPLAVIRRELASVWGVAGLVGGAMRDGALLARLIRARGIAIVHSNTSVVLGGVTASALARVPHVWHVREIYSRFPRLWPAYRRLLAGADALACISDATAAQFRPGDPVAVIRDALAIDHGTAPAVSGAAARAQLGLPESVPIVAVVGRVSDWKGQDVLVRALADQRLRDRGVIGVVAGEPWPGAEERLARVLSLARELGVMDRLRLLGFRSDVETVYVAADVIAVPSIEPEPLGDVAIEAAACGCAVVASAHGGLLEIVRDRETGRLVPPRDLKALPGVIAELLDDPAERKRLGAAAARDALQRFAPARLLEDLQQLYDSLLDR